MVGCLASSLLWQGPENGRSYYESRGEIVWEVPGADKRIALTFDDGPDAEQTPKILDILKRYDAKATFFVVGKRVDRFPDIVRRELAEGHELANHTYSHPYFQGKVSAERLQKEIKTTQDAIWKATGATPRLFRPPGGYYSQSMVNATKELGYLIVLWSWHQDTVDWNRPGVGKIVNKVLNNARSGDIVLFHDFVEGRTQTVEALERIMPELQKRGYTFVTVSELLEYRRKASAPLR
ncbi:polysaccharide deacetylase family protein [Paenibacillus sp. MBLB4367]|uniref:polysaccharide deacetylase family protein n=1 Tax=Paenibacillus sp. MBLB4367 TaxID=3384767 RepID=UPI0039082080